MQTILQWFNNAWFVGIFGGIVSGFVVNYLSRLFLSKRENREYLQKLFSGNREVIYSIRPCIPEGTVPTSDTVEALIVATARKYGVNHIDMYGPLEIVQELTKEVMDSSFISSQIKQQYCERLLAIVPRRPQESEPPAVSASGSSIEARIVTLTRRDRAVDWISMVFGLSTGLTSLVIALFSISGREQDVLSSFSEKFDKTGVFIPLVGAIVALVMSFVMLPSLRMFVNLDRSRQRTDLDDRGSERSRAAESLERNK